MGEKFLLISQVFYPDQVSTANLFTDLCCVLAGEGVVVEVWAAHPSYTEYRRQPRKLLYKGMIIRYLPSTNFRKTSFAGKMLNILTFAFSAGIKVLFSGDKTPVWTHTTFPFAGILLSSICRLKKRKFAYILLDIFPEGLIRLGKVSGRNPFIVLWQRSFIRTLERSDKVIAIGRDMKKMVNELCPACAEKVIYLPHWQNEELIFPLKFSESRYARDNQLSGNFVVQYSGNMGLWNDMETIGRVVRRNFTEVIFIFVGDGMRKKELTDQFSSGGQPNVIMLPFQPNENLNDILAASHVHLVTLREGLEGMAVPSKIYGILASGRPVIALVPGDSEIALVVREENCGIVVRPDDENGLADAIMKLKTDRSLCEEMGKKSRLAFEKKYTTKVVAQDYRIILNELLTYN